MDTPGESSAERVLAWTPVGILVLAAAVPDLRLAGLGALAVGAIGVSARSGRRSAAAGPWLGATVVATALAWGIALAPSVPLAGTARCTDALSPTALARAIEGAAVLALLALLVAIHGDRAALLLRPSSRRITGLALAAPFVIVPATLWIGPALAAPFFGSLQLEVGDLRALLPAALFAISNAALEELAYRGALMGWAGRALGMRGALLGQAVVFGFAHMGLDVAPATAPILWAGMGLSGLIAGLAVVRTRSLLLAVAVHAAVDVSLYYALACRAAG